jgi:hypothetical protein
MLAEWNDTWPDVCSECVSLVEVQLRPIPGSQITSRIPDVTPRRDFDPATRRVQPLRSIELDARRVNVDERTTEAG